MGRRMAWTAKVTGYEPNKKWGGSVSFGSMLVEEHIDEKQIIGYVRWQGG